MSPSFPLSLFPRQAELTPFRPALAKLKTLSVAQLQEAMLARGANKEEIKLGKKKKDPYVQWILEWQDAQAAGLCLDFTRSPASGVTF